MSVLMHEDDVIRHVSLTLTDEGWELLQVRYSLGRGLSRIDRSLRSSADLVAKNNADGTLVWVEAKGNISAQLRPKKANEKQKEAGVLLYQALLLRRSHPDHKTDRVMLAVPQDDDWRRFFYLDADGPTVVDMYYDAFGIGIFWVVDNDVIPWGWI